MQIIYQRVIQYNNSFVKPLYMCEEEHQAHYRDPLFSFQVGINDMIAAYRYHTRRKQFCTQAAV